MARHLTQKPLIIQDENLNILGKKALGDRIPKRFGGATKKGATGAKDRKALNDITNKSSLQNEILSKKKVPLRKEEFNYAEEGFLHDHKKCVAEQQAMRRPDFLDTVLPGHNEFWNTRPDKSNVDIESMCYYPEPVEMPILELSEWVKSSSTWKSPPSSPIHVDFPISSPFSWQHEPVEFTLKEDDYC